ncbi:hypothetical protein TcasGA2_TC012526 [Tribolium castaneum]|uniref:Chloride channel CLIC-like protein 1 n=2 Tax=Tribolium castaneum TaxID=7070 RepID=D6X323_TRICA|nr:hypothetical protein TcasGA2_TC012526 [Tribolium castaneum]
MYQDLKYFVAPSKVLTRQFRTLIVEPGGDLGEAFGKFGRGMFATLPWGLNVVLFPIMLVAACVMIFIFFLFITKPNFKLSLFHLFSIELGQPVRHQPTLRGNDTNTRQIAGARRRRTRNQGREVGHRALVEDVSNDKTSSSGKTSPEKSPQTEGASENKLPIKD